MPPLCRKGDGSDAGGVARRDRGHVPVPPAAISRHRRRLLSAPRRGSVRRPCRGSHRGLGSSELPSAAGHAGAPRRSQSRSARCSARRPGQRLPEGRPASASLCFLSPCRGGLLASGLPHHLLRTAAPKELLPSSLGTVPRPPVCQNAPTLPLPSCLHPRSRLHRSGAGQVRRDELHFMRLKNKIQNNQPDNINKSKGHRPGAVPMDDPGAPRTVPPR